MEVWIAALGLAAALAALLLLKGKMQKAGKTKGRIVLAVCLGLCALALAVYLLLSGVLLYAIA